MTRKEIHDLVNIVSPAMSMSQNLLLNLHGDLTKEQRNVVKKIESCLKELQRYLQQQGRQAEAP